MLVCISPTVVSIGGWLSSGYTAWPHMANRKAEATQEHEHDPSVLPCHSVALAETRHHLEPSTEFINIPSVPR